MSTFLSETLGVADSGTYWDVGNFKLFQSTRPDTVLFITKQPQVVKMENGRYAFAATSYSQQQPDHSIKVTGGSAMFTITSAIQFDPKAFQDAQNSWKAAMGPAAPPNVRFVPLNVQKGEATVLIDPAMGTPDKAHNDKDVGTPGGTLSFLIELSELGAQAFSQAIKNRTAIPGGVKFMYEYLRMMPDVGAVVTVHGQRVFQHLSAALNVSYNGFLYGGSAKLEAAWDDMQRNGAVEVTFIGSGLPPDLEKLRQDMTTTFAQQALQILWNQIFAPMPDVAPAQAGSSGGLFGGANFALKWKKQSDAIDLSQTIRFQGMTWLKASMDTDFTTLFAGLDPSYLTEVQPQQAFDISVVVDSDPTLSNVGLSLTYSEGRSPDAPVFNQNGGAQRYTAVSMHPNDVKVSCSAKIDYAPPSWSIISYTTAATVGQGGNQIVIKTASWVGRHQIFLFVRDGNQIIPPTSLTDNDYLILNVSYSGPHLPAPIRDAAHLSGLEMVEFDYPLDPQGRPSSVAKFSAFGVIRGKLVSAPEQVIPENDTAVFILATTDGKIQLLTSASAIGEDDPLATYLVRAGARPVLGDGVAAETGKQPVPVPSTNGTDGAGQVLSGQTIGVEYSAGGAALWIRGFSGARQKILFKHVEESYPFESGTKQVQVKLDDSGQYASSILVELAD